MTHGRCNFSRYGPWASDAGIIECDDTELGLVDLHNERDLLELQVAPGSDANLIVRLVFRHQSASRNFGLSFAAVSGFGIAQLEYHSSDALLFHDLSHVPSGSASSDIEIALASMRLDFRAPNVEFLLL